MEPNKILNEICEVSAMKASSALSKFLHAPVKLHINPIEIRNIHDIKTLIQEDRVTANLFLPIGGNINGVSFFFYSKKAALIFCDLLFQRPKGTTQEFGEAEISALSEVANIVLGNFLTSFAHSLQLDFLMHRSAEFECDMFSNLIAKRLPDIYSTLKEAVIKIQFTFQQVEIEGFVIIMFEEEKVKNILTNIFVPSDQ